jgi:hypothetical protein
MGTIGDCSASALRRGSACLSAPKVTYFGSASRLPPSCANIACSVEKLSSVDPSQRGSRRFKRMGKPSMSRKAIVLITTSFVLSTMSTAVLAAGQETVSDQARMVRMMDKDHNGVVSKEEFMQYMGQVFDRIDTDKSGSLDHRELRRTSLPRALRRDCVHRTFPECSGS